MPALPRFSLTGSLLFILFSVSPSVIAGETLTLARAEQLALANAPLLSHHRTNVTAASERAVYESRLPDPQLMIGVVNVPTDSFSTRQDDMTMQMIGIRQSFPPGDTLALKERRAQKDVSREEAKLEIERRMLIKKVRQLWLDLYVQEQSVHLVEESRALQSRALAAAEGRYRAAQEPQRAVMRARQELARLDDRLLMLKAQASGLRAQLGRWLGDAANDPLPPEPPILPLLATDFDVARHPTWLAAQAGREVAQAEVDIARQQYKPGMMFDLTYGVRQNAPSGMQRSNMVSAVVTFDLPIFRNKRQDRRLTEKQSLETAAGFEADDMRRDLESMYRAVLAEYNALKARARVAEEQLLPSARAEAKATAAGGARDANEIREAQMRALDAELDLIRLRADLAKSHAELLYLTGEPQS